MTLLWSQASLSSTISVQDARPLAQAIVQLQTHVRLPINYEDVRYRYASDIADVTTTESRPDVAVAHPGFRLLIPKRGSLAFSFYADALSQTATDPDAALQAAIAAQNSRGVGGEYQMVKANDQYYVVPASSKDVNGNRTPTASVLMEPVSFPLETSSPAQFVETILAQVSASCGYKIGIGNMPLQGFLATKVTLAAASEPARDVLSRLFRAVAQRRYADGTVVTALAYRLLFDPGDQAYMLNVRVAVPPEVSPKNLAGQSIPVPKSNSPVNPWFKAKP